MDKISTEKSGLSKRKYTEISQRIVDMERNLVDAKNDVECAFEKTELPQTKVDIHDLEKQNAELARKLDLQARENEMASRSCCLVSVH